MNQPCLSGCLPSGEKRRDAEDAERVEQGCLCVSLRLGVSLHVWVFYFGKQPDKQGFNNLGGTIDVQSGRVTLAGSGNSTNGTFNVSAGAVLDLNGGGTMVYSGAFIGSGAGQVERVPTDLIKRFMAGQGENFPNESFTR